MIHLEILLEEESMREVLKIILPQLGITSYRFHVHQGKKNLLRQLPKILRGYSNYIPENYRILVILDQDTDDCHELKQGIIKMSEEAQISKLTKIRIVVKMLEAWFFGDPAALEQAFPKLKKRSIGTKETYRNPEERPDPARDLDRELKDVGEKTGYMKTTHSQKIAQYLSLEGNTCPSFHITIQALKDLGESKGESI